MLSIRGELGALEAVLAPAATPAQAARAAQLCAAPPAPSPAEKADEIRLPARVVAALVKKARLGALAPAWVDNVLAQAEARIDAS